MVGRVVVAVARVLLILFFAVLLPLRAQGQKVYTYVGRIGTDSFLLAWGTTTGEGNTIGRNSVSLGKTAIEVDGRQLQSAQNWVEVSGLTPDTEYSYRVLLEGREIGKGTIRTYPKRAAKLSFFVLGDYGTGKPPQYEIAEAMWREFEKRKESDQPVRFVLTTGDNIYSNRVLGVFPTRTGGRDRDWGEKFFEPYERLLRQIPFYPTLGNHDRREGAGKTSDDLMTYLDNFFPPSAEATPYYTFSFGGLADFFALDTTALWHEGPLEHSLSEKGGQFLWLRQAMARSGAPWKIAYFHHPPFNAGPGHPASLDSLRHVVELFEASGVQVVFSGHEHNFQYARRNGSTGATLYVITGAGGQLRTGNISNAMSKASIAGTAAQHHFLLVEIEDRTLKITTLSSEPVIVRDQHGNPLPIPIVVQLPYPGTTL